MTIGMFTSTFFKFFTFFQIQKVATLYFFAVFRTFSRTMLYASPAWWGFTCAADVTGNVLKHPYDVLFSSALYAADEPSLSQLVADMIIFDTILTTFCINFCQIKPTTSTIFDLVDTLLSKC